MGGGNAHGPRAEEPEARDQRALGPTSLAIVLYLLLADAMIETFLSRSPARWWVVVIVVVYLGGTAVFWWRRDQLWQRFGWATKATTSAFFLLGLVTVTAWLPDGLTHGVTFFGLSTSTVLSLMTALAVAFSGSILFRLNFPHPAIKWGIAALTAYGAVAFLWGIYSGTSYSSLLGGQSLWIWLPRWLQGAFIGGLIVIPAAVVVQALSRRLRVVPGALRGRRFGYSFALLLALLTAIAAATIPVGSALTPGQTSDRGPGMRPQSLDSLVLPVPRTFDLAHVDPAYFSVALGKDPSKIFEFVRNQIAYEAYPGVLRGARGTLLAMAGNSADRALLLASLLTNSGYTVRFARGTLSEPDARDLAGSMWTSVQRARIQNTGTSDGATAAVRAFVDSGRRDFAQIRDALKTVKTRGTKAAPSLDTIVQESRVHYWVQLAKDGEWIDLDPSFADSTIGRSYARSDATLPALPTNLYHRVTMRIMVEKSDGAQSRTEELGRYSANAADLSGTSVLLVHVPENWRGPVQSIGGALASAFSETGRIRPVLLVMDQQPIVGAPFPVEVKTTGAGGIQNLLSGAGTRNPVEIATEEWIEFTFDYPDRHSEIVVREVFDLVGKAKRTRGESLKQDDIRVLAAGNRASTLTTTVLSMFFTTGRLDASHLASLAQESDSQPPERRGSDVLLRRLGITFTIISDTLLEKVKTSDGTVVRFYPDSPRVLIAEFSMRAKHFRMAIDLRRDHARAAATGSDGESVFAATVMRGVVDGTLERMLVEYVAARMPGTIDLNVGISTSMLFERAQTAHVAPLLVTNGQERLDASILDDARARLLDDIRQGNYALALQHPISVADVPRYAWWRINPRTGETIAVTDDGLYQVTAEGQVVITINPGRMTYSAVLVTENAEVPLATMMKQAEMESLVFRALLEGYNVLGPL